MTWPRRFRGFRREPGKMNRLEAAYAQELEKKQTAGEIIFFKYEGITLRLAPRCSYTPDFIVMLANGDLVIHEVKGSFQMDDARVKVKCAAEMFPFKFFIVTREKVRDGGGWKFEEF